MRAIALMFMFAFGLYAQNGPKQVVFDLTTGDLKRFEQVVLKGTETHTTHYGSTLQEYKAVFVIHGDAYRFFLSDLRGTPYEGERELARRLPELAARLASLVENYDVTFEVCSFGMKSRQLPFEQLYPFVRPIFSATTGLIDWQERGYAYVPVR